MHENACDMQRKIASWAQPNPILPAHNQITYITHI